jgi:hypothetical protein
VNLAASRHQGNVVRVHEVHEPDVRSKNHTGSSKGMEAAGAAKIVNRLFLNPTNKCCVGCFVTNDDPSMRKTLAHSCKEQLETLEIPWPRHQGNNGKMGKKKLDDGLLPLLHAVNEVLANKGHQVCGNARSLFLEAAKSIANGCGLTKVDAGGCRLRLHASGTCKNLRRAVRAVLEHHSMITSTGAIGAKRKMGRRRKLARWA